MTPPFNPPWAWALHAGYLEDDHGIILNTCQAAGIHLVNMPARHVNGRTVQELEALEQNYREIGIRMDSFHLPFTAQDDIASFYETERRQAACRTSQWLERIPALKVRVAVLHPGTHRYSVDIEGLDPFMRQLGRSLEELLPAAESAGVQLALENMLPGPDGGRLGSRPEHFARFVAEFEHSHLGFCLDTGHALVSDGPEGVGAFIEAMAGHIVAFHLADNAGDRDSHLAPGHGRVDWAQFFRQVARMGYPYGMCVEAPPFAPGPNYRPEAWQRMFSDLDQLVEQALMA